MFKKLTLFLISLAVGIIIFIKIGDFIGWEEIKNSFQIFSHWQGLLIFILTLLMMLIANWRWKEILRGEKENISFWYLVRPFLIGFSVMFIAPTFLGMGEALRVYDLKGRKNISWSKSMASVIIDRILEWTTNLFFIFIGILFLLYKIGFPPKNLVIIFGGVLLFFVVVICLFYIKAWRRESFVKSIGRLFNRKLDPKPLETEEEIFNFFRSENKAVWKSFGLSFLRAAVMYLRTCFLISFLGNKMSALSCLSVLGFTYLAAIIPIPASLGTHEVLQTFAFKSLGFSISSATAFTMIIRTAELIFALTGIILILRRGVISLKNFLSKNI